MGDVTTLTELTIRELTERLASRDPVPGGGSASALAGALGAALVTMVVELTAGRPEAAAHDEQVRALGAEAMGRQSRLLELAEDDARAYAAVVEARRLPKGTDAERERRASALGRAMRDAARIPLDAAGVAADVLDLARQLAPIGNRNAVSDAGVAAHLAAAAARGAMLNVQINLPYLPAGDPLREEATAALTRLESIVGEREESALREVALRLEPA